MESFFFHNLETGKNWESVMYSITNDFYFKLIVCCILILFTFYVVYRYICYYIQEIPNADIYNIDNCPICLYEFSAPVRATCGHAFCIKCLLRCFTLNKCYWKCTCPLCRSLVKDITSLDKFHFSNKEHTEKIKLEKELRKLIMKQNSNLTRVRGSTLIITNNFKIIVPTLGVTIGAGVFLWFFF